MHSEYKTDLDQATRTAKRRAVAIVGGAFLMILAVGVGALFYLARSDAEAATRNVQRYYVRGGVARAHVQDCSKATDYERSLQLYSCKVSSRDAEVFDITPAPAKTADTANLCFSIQDANATLRPVRFFGIATRSDPEVCALPDRAAAIYEP